MTETSTERRPLLEFSIEQKLEELGRVIHQRKKDYPRSIKIGRMTQDEADRRIACIKAIAKDYQQQKRGRSK